MQTSKADLKIRNKILKANVADDTLGSSPFFKEMDTASMQKTKNRFFPYKFALFFHDLIIVFFVFGFSDWMINFEHGIDRNLYHIITLFIFSLVAISFFPTFNLYNYHVIFLKRKHLTGLAKSFGWSLLTLGIITAIFMLPHLFSNVNLIIIITLIAFGMMVLSRYFWQQLLYLIRSIGIGFVVVGILGMIMPDESFNHSINLWIIAFGFLSANVILTAGRYFVVHIVYNLWLRRNFRRQIAIIGSDEEAKNIINHIVTYNAPYWVVGTIGESGLDTDFSKHRLGTLTRLSDIVEQNKIEELLVTDENIEKINLISLLDYCTNKEITVWFPKKLMPIIGMKLNMDNFCDLQMIKLCSQKNTWLFNKIKHGIDAFLTLPMVIILSPLFLLISVAIKVNSKGPVFYRAEAVGKNGKIFTMYKFRSMRENNQSDIHKKYVTKLIKGEIFNENAKFQPLKITDDPRITAVGKFLRKYSLDELPQLINVLKGEMSLVGPRPCLQYEFEIYKNWHKKRSCVRPGITGLWQVAGRSAVAFEDMILLDLYYIYNRGLSLDFNTLYETIFVVFGKQGAY